MTLLVVLLLALDNPGFDEGLAGWTRADGAVRDPAGPSAEVVVEDDAARFTAASEDRRWPMLAQVVDCAPGLRVLLTVRARCENLRHEKGQYRNANAAVFFEGAGGRRLGVATTPRMRGDRDWIDLHAHALAPPGTQRARIVLFSSVTGRLWFDDVRLRIAPNTEAFALEALRLHLDRTYPFLDFRKPGEGGLLPTLRALGDLHVWLRTPAGVVPTTRPRGRRDRNEKADRARLTRVTHDRDGHLVGWIGDVGFGRIAHLEADGFDALLEKLAPVLAAPRLVLDLRVNRGGDERLARRIAARLTDRRLVYAKSQVRDPTKPGVAFLPPHDRVLVGKRPAREDRRLCVLQGPSTASSAEAFVLMLRALDGVTTMGRPTRGASGNPKPFAFDAQRTVFVPAWRALTPDGKRIEGRGVEPDVEEENDALARALKLLRLPR